MLTLNNRCMCEFCFSQLPPKTKDCPYCSCTSNNEKYPTALSEGLVLMGRYVVGRVLGKGGFGITYLCYDTVENKTVAVKEFLPDALTHRNSGDSMVRTYNDDRAKSFQSGASKFYEEAKLVSRFNGNPNIISVHEFFYENNTAYFVMEYLDGVDFKHYIYSKGRRIPEGEAIYMLSKMTEALMIVHSIGVLHRDISPDNIFLCNTGNIKLIDFGAARQVFGEESKSLSVILKQGFAPLEQYQKHGKQGPWTDIYALGATMYYAVTGKLVDDAMSRIDDDTLDLSGVSEGFGNILKKMLAVKIQDRYQDVIAIKRDLTELSTASVPPQLQIKTEQKSFCERCGCEVANGQVICDNCRMAGGAGVTSASNFTGTMNQSVRISQSMAINNMNNQQGFFDKFPGGKPAFFSIIAGAGVVVIALFIVLISALMPNGEIPVVDPVEDVVVDDNEVVEKDEEAIVRNVPDGIVEMQYASVDLGDIMVIAPSGEDLNWKMISSDTATVGVEGTMLRLYLPGKVKISVQAEGKEVADFNVIVTEYVDHNDVQSYYDGAFKLLDTVKNSSNANVKALKAELEGLIGAYKDVDFSKMSSDALVTARDLYLEQAKDVQDELQQAYDSSKKSTGTKKKTTTSQEPVTPYINVPQLDL